MLTASQVTSEINLRTCKICGGEHLSVFAHTAQCRSCGVLLYYPYPVIERKLGDIESIKRWYNASSFYNHVNFTHMIRFCMGETDKGNSLSILDYGGGGGQFAPVLLSHFPVASVYFVDIQDTIHPTWAPMQTLIPFDDFETDETLFDVIFLNDVFEHVEDPLQVLSLLSRKLKPGGRIFIDTPKQFWIYPLTKIFSTSLYTKVLKGTVSKSHLQIWTQKSFDIVVRKSSLRIAKLKTVSEYTMPADYYLKNMKIKNPLLRLAGRLFYAASSVLAKNKIVCVLVK